MHQLPSSDRPPIARALLIAIVAFASYVYFYQGGGWNQNSRFDLVRAILERGTLRIDAYHENTEDKTIANGHFYSDKAPGLALLVLPAAAASIPVLRAIGVDPASPRGLVAMSYIAAAFSVALPMALAWGCLFLIALRFGSNVSGAAIAALTMGLATPLWPYSTLLWGHATAAAFLLFGFGFALKLKSSHANAGDLLWGFLLGLSAGIATITEYPAAPAGLVLGALAFALVWNGGWHRRIRIGLSVSFGFLACMLVLALYQKLAFGSAFHPSYAYYQPGSFPWMKRGYMGLTYPRPDVMLKLLFGCRRGLLITAPALIFAPLGLRILCKQSATRIFAYAATAIAGYYFIFHSSFLSWPGGWSYGPRYMAAGIPFLCIGVAPVWTILTSRWRKILLALTACGALFSLMAVSTVPAPPDEFRCPLVQLIGPSFWHGHFSLNHGSMLRPFEDDAAHIHGAFNLGEMMGLHGLLSLGPLLAFWVLAAGLWRRLDRPSSRPMDTGAKTNA